MPEPVPRSRLDPNRGCRDKIRWPTEAEAVAAAECQEADFGDPMEAYPCPHCGHWHTGNVPLWLRLDREYGVWQAS